MFIATLGSVMLLFAENSENIRLYIYIQCMYTCACIYIHKYIKARYIYIHTCMLYIHTCALCTLDTTKYAISRSGRGGRHHTYSTICMFVWIARICMYIHTYVYIYIHVYECIWLYTYICRLSLSVNVGARNTICLVGVSERFA